MSPQGSEAQADARLTPLLASFDALPPAERRALSLLAVAHEPLHHTDMGQLLKRLGLRTEQGTQISMALLLEWCARWMAASLIREDHLGSLAVTSALQYALLDRLFASGELPELASQVRAERRLLTRGYWVERGAASRELLLSAYLGPSTELEEGLRRLEGPGSRGAEPGLWLEALGVAPPAKVLQKLEPVMLRRYLGELFSLLSDTLEQPSEAVLRCALQQFSELDARACALVCQHLCLCGRAEEGLALVEELHGADGASMRALCLLVLGRFDQARFEARTALELSHAKSSGRFKGFKGPLAPFLALLLATGEDPRGHELAHALVTHKQALSWSRDVLRALSLLLQARGGSVAYAFPTATLDDESEVSALLKFHAPDSWQGFLFWALLGRARGASFGKRFVEALAKLRRRVDAGGYLWLASELARATDDTAQGLFRLYQREEPWERALRALEAELQRASARPLEPPPKAERLVWSLVVDRTGHQVSARVQTKTASGYSAGRQVSWKTLAQAPNDAPFFSPEDAPILACITLDKKYAQYGYSPSYLLSPEAPLALVGHPRVFADHECRRPTRVVRGRPRVDVIEEQGQLVVRMVPPELGAREIVCLREAEDRVAVYALSPEQEGVGKLLRQGLKLPPEAKSRATTVLSRLVTYFPVASDLELEDGGVAVEKVEGDGRLCVDLRPAQHGLTVSVVVAPLEDGTVFVPGEGPSSVLAELAHEGVVRRVRCDRDHARERADVEALLQACPTLLGLNVQRPLSVPARLACLELLCELSTLGERVRVRWPEGQPLRVLGERDARDVKLRLAGQGHWLAPQGELQIDETLKLSLSELLQRYARRDGRFIELENGQFVALTERLSRALSTLSRSVHKKGDALALHPLVADVLFDDVEEWGAVETDREVQARLTRLAAARATEPELPQGFDAELRPYQHEGFQWIERLFAWGAGACLADDMGLGKTLQTLAVLLAHAPEGPSLVVAPMSVCDNWLNEAAKFAPALRLAVLTSADRGAILESAGPFDVIVCSYGIMQQSIEAFERVSFAVTVLDEAQAIKNATTQRARAAMRLPGAHRLALTGTPIENHLGELWSLFNFLNPGLLGSARAFEQHFGRPIQREGDRSAEQALKRLLRPFVLRRTKGEVLDDLPPKTEVTLHVEPSAAEAALFDALREQALKKLNQKDAPAEQRMRILAEIMRLRRAACHPQLVAPEAGVSSSKLETFEALVEELRSEGHRALVFSQFVDYLHLVRTRLDRLGVSYQYLDGSSTRAARANAVAKFSGGEGDVFLISLKAGGFGLNLTAADYVIHLDPWWNPAVEDQASDRAHRIGQTRPVTVYRLVMKSSIEEKILGLHARKRELSDSLLDGTSSATALSVEELRELLR
jgi:superfamily II DNA or RNA helicase